MASYDSNEVAELLRQLGNHAQLLAEAYVSGAVSDQHLDSRKLLALQKKSILRPGEDPGDFRVGAELKRLLNRLMRKQSGYRQLTDMGKVIDILHDAVTDYQYSVTNNQEDDAEYYFDQLDDLIYEAKESLDNSLDSMHRAIASQFGFVTTISAKVKENQRALDYAQKLLVELQQIDPESCYEWVNWPCPVEFARKISDFIYWFNQALPRLRYIIDSMRNSLFKLRREEKQASMLRNMARYLNHHPEFEIPEQLFTDSKLPNTLRLAPPLAMQSYVDVRETQHQQALIALVQSLRKYKAPEPLKDRDVAEVELLSNQPVIINYDFFEEQTERLFEQVIESGEPISVIEYWQSNLVGWQSKQQDIEPVTWLELVFSSYCKLTNAQQALIEIKPKGTQVKGISHNWSFHDIVIVMVK